MLPSIDAVVVGSVAVTESGIRIGKGEGYSDLEFAILRELGTVDGDTPTVTTVHDIQVVEESVAEDRYDVPIDVICTPTQTVHTNAAGKPAGVYWSELEEIRRAEIPVLDRLR